MYKAIKPGDNLWKIKIKNQIRWLWAFLTGAVLIIYGIYATGFLRVGIDSDYSNLVLEATDILNGNPFLEGHQNLTGISFVTTDLLFFIIGVLLYLA